MASDNPNTSPVNQPVLTPAPDVVTAIVPARNEEAVIAACIESLARQSEIAQILVVNDQSSDATADVVRNCMKKIPDLRLLETNNLPEGWVGKNHALWVGVQQANRPWLLFTDADAQHSPNSVARALEIANEQQAALVSFSPEQVSRNWYEKALIPFIYLRLAKKFSYDCVNDPKSPVAAANGQFMLIRRDVYDAIGGHGGVAGEVLEDVAIALRVKQVGHRIWFSSGQGLVRTRMYSSFGAMWEGWKKNLYRLMGGTPWTVVREMESTLPWIPFVLMLLGLRYPFLLFLGVLFLVARQTIYGLDLARNHYPFSFIFYYIPGVFLYAGVLWASYRSHVKGRIAWKGREYSIGAPESVK
ncbi:MAG TPA: glycosyltransferase family 2 protein [Candidatus Acidoferrum sp.]|nr:glycosyltransferase family 2 protein [Candidatus Acidoferrum sp.]